MTPNEFEQLVRDMRIRQKEYYRTKTQSALQRAVEYEKKVDDYLALAKVPTLPFK